MPSNQTLRQDVAPASPAAGLPRVVLSFDIEEHHRIEAASSLTVSEGAQAAYRRRMEDSTRWLLESLAARGIRATFFVIGELAQLSRRLVQEVAEAGHEVGSHGWDHRRVLAMTPEEFRQDARQSKDALEQVTGQPVRGYRAPTFSIVRQTSWALEVLAEEGYTYDSSIYPVRHDRYGVPDAPLVPFLVPTAAGSILELPPLTLRLAGMNLPVGGGGYFRIFPSWLMRTGVRRMAAAGGPVMLYFHPWEFDEGQERLPLPLLSRLRTYHGIKGSQERLGRLMDTPSRFATAAEVARESARQAPVFEIGGAVPLRNVLARSETVVGH